MALRYLTAIAPGRCASTTRAPRALAEELDVSPGSATRELDGLIRRGQPLPPIRTMATPTDGTERQHDGGAPDPADPHDIAHGL